MKIFSTVPIGFDHFATAIEINASIMLFTSLIFYLFLVLPKTFIYFKFFLMFMFSFYVINYNITIKQ